MYVNNKVLILFGLVVALFLAIFSDLFFMVLWSLIFWSWYFIKPTIKKEDVPDLDIKREKRRVIK